MLDSSQPLESHHPTLLDAFCALLQKRMGYEEGERDMAFMYHELIISSASGKKSKLSSTLIEYGDPKGYSAMAKTVGIPAAIAAEMLLQGKIKGKGVVAPLDRSIYIPLLETLSSEDIHFKETAFD
jgi:saccharopine dehydrogenase-like NADP-dependent oxidoreductase